MQEIVPTTAANADSDLTNAVEQPLNANIKVDRLVTIKEEVKKEDRETMLTEELADNLGDQGVKRKENLDLTKKKEQPIEEQENELTKSLSEALASKVVDKIHEQKSFKVPKLRSKQQTMEPDYDSEE